ncbi:hypothetical protein DIS24_g11468 [Lasiodiplodia hormozganensis]|uniref:Uncharacterized protein n=1 Tax=Lasiodiplodia hormozganensis TaxID=869390 RepID=A0AA40C1J3_9PEZI|nr:hypothetical protein DIS24_g11468 [Lasiodiplodia hormozganensis]
MKTSNAILSLAALAAQASALVQMEVRYSDNMVDVGDMDIFAATWQTLYDLAGNQRSVMTDRSVESDNNRCKHQLDADKKDLTVQVKMNGAWGQTPGLQQNQMREALISSMWEVLKAVSDKEGYEMFKTCYSFTWSEGGASKPENACGRSAARTCDTCGDSAGLAECVDHTWGHKVPSSMRVTAYIDNQLQPDDLIIEFASAKNPTSSGGCGWVGEVAGLVSGFIPVAGDLFAKGIELGCME